MSFYFYLIFFFCGIFSLVLVRYHILLILMCLEFNVLCLLLMISFFCLMFSSSMYLYLFYMIFYVCEGALGLGVLVYMIRCFGNDYLSSFSLW